MAARRRTDPWRPREPRIVTSAADGAVPSTAPAGAGSPSAGSPGIGSPGIGSPGIGSAGMGAPGAGGPAPGRSPHRVVRGTIADLAAGVAELDPDSGGLAGGDLGSLLLAGARVLGGEATGLRLRDVVADQAVLAGIILDGGGATRVRIRGGRLSGTVWIRGEFHDADLDGARADGLTLRFCALHRTRFARCDLTGLDLTGSRLDHVEFEDCDLTKADFTGARIDAARFRGCRFDAVVGAAGLAGAEIDADDLMTLAGPMAGALGITVV